MNDFVKDTTEIPSLSFGTPEPEPELPVQQPEEKKEVMDDSVLSDEQKAMVMPLFPRLILPIQTAFCSTVPVHRRKWQTFPRKRWKTSEAKISGKSAICSPLL